MKSIKLISFLIGLIFFGTTILSGQENIEWDGIKHPEEMNNTTPYSFSSIKKDTIEVKVNIDSNPVTFTIEHEELDKNEALTKVMELNVEERDMLNQNLKELNSTIQKLPFDQIQAKLDLLDFYGIDNQKIAQSRRTIFSISYIIGVIFLVIKAIIFTSSGGFLYTNKRDLYNETIQLVLGTFLFFYATPKVLCYLFVENYQLWLDVSKLF